jgi:hypothetical protein
MSWWGAWYWIPAEDLHENIVGRIEVVAEFR